MTPPAISKAKASRDARRQDARRPPDLQVVSTASRPQWSRGWRAAILCIFSGCLWFLACTPHDLWLLAWVAMVPALFVLDRCSTARRAGFYCWISGAVTTAGGFYWMIELLRRFAGMDLASSVLIYALFCAYQGIISLLFGIVVYTLRRRTRLPMILLAPLVIVPCELIVPLIFPFHHAIMLAWHPITIQIADLAGPLGVTALLFVINGAVYDVLTDRAQRWKSAMAGALILAAVLLYGLVRMRQFDAAAASAPKLAVGVVQPNVAYDEKGLKHPELAASQLRDLQEQSRQLEKSGAQLIVWNESSYPYSLPSDLKSDFPETDPRRIRPGFSTPTVIGALTRSPDRSILHNSALLIDRQGNIAGRYDKMRLLAFGETIPAVDTFPWLRDLVPTGFGDFTPGKEANSLPLQIPGLGDLRLGAIICYEDILPELLRQVGEKHPHLMINLTNDTWFGEKAEPWQHLALAVFGSVEERTSMVRAVNSGVSAFIDPNGRVVQQTYAVDPFIHPHAATSSLAIMPVVEGGHTVYARVGNLFAYLCALGTLSLLLFKRGERAKRP